MCVYIYIHSNTKALFIVVVPPFTLMSWGFRQEILSSRKKPYLLKAAQAGNARLVTLGGMRQLWHEVPGQASAPWFLVGNEGPIYIYIYIDIDIDMYIYIYIPFKGVYRYLSCSFPTRDQAVCFACPKEHLLGVRCGCQRAR